jgi:hypothetical protein
LAQNKNEPIIYGPYFNPNKDESYLITISQAVYNKSELYGVLNTDIRLQFDEQRSPLDDGTQINYSYIVIDPLLYYYFIVDTKGKPLMHSRAAIENNSTTLTDLVCYLDDA